MMFNRLQNGKSLTAAAARVAFCMSLFVTAGNVAAANTSKEDIALSMATLLRSARAVVSDNQSLINDSGKGDKGFTGKFVKDEAAFDYRMATGVDIDNIDPSSLQGELLHAELEAITEIVAEWQDRINQKGVGYKGFLPAVFAFQVTQRFTNKMGKKAEIKLTAPAEYVRNKRNMPDHWERSMIDNHLKSPDYPMGRHIAAIGEKDGQTAFRLILPEYYTMSCLGCHGQPKGALDKTGGRKEGGVLGGLGGAISVIIHGNTALSPRNSLSRRMPNKGTDR